MLLPGMCSCRNCRREASTCLRNDVETSRHAPELVFELADASALWNVRQPSIRRGKSQAQKLRRALQCLTAQDWKRQILRSIPLIEFGGVIAAVGGLLSPKGPGGCDHNRLERVANVLTSAPYIAIGAHTFRKRSSRAGKLWGASIAAVGAASATFHASSGRFRSIGRKLDYWTIALSSTFLAKAVFPDLPSSVSGVGLALTPFKPFLVSFVNSTAMEAVFLERSWRNPKLQVQQKLHSACALLGLGAFVLEEYMPQLPLVHATWHCLSAVCIGSTNALLQEVEREQQGGQVKVEPLCFN